MSAKVIHVITRLDHGGSAQNTLLTCLGHDRARFDPLVIAGHPGRWDAQGGDAATRENQRRLQERGLPCELLPTLTREVHPIKDLKTIQRLTRIFRRERPVIVHTHTSKAGAVGRIAAQAARVPVVVHTPHGHVFYGHFGRTLSRLFLETERWLARRTTWLIALTEAERDEHLARGVGRADRFAVVPSGIELERFRRMAGVVGHRPDAFDCPPDALVVGSVGWLTPIKGYRYLIEAVARLRPAHPRLHVVLIGTGDLRAPLAALADRLGIRDRVRFLGQRADIPACLAAMDLFVLPSLNEGMGRALVEAMAAGRPVIATRVGGVPAVVEHRRTGLLVPPADAAALAVAIDELARNSGWAKQLAEAGQQSIGARFSAAHMVRGVEAVYEQALAGVGLT